MLASEDDEDARIAAVALGKIASAEAVAPLIEAAKRPSIEKDVLTAIGATNTGEAALFLKDLEEEVLANPESGAELRWHLSYLRSPRFRADLATAQAERRRRYKRP